MKRLAVFLTLLLGACSQRACSANGAAKPQKGAAIAAPTPAPATLASISINHITGTPIYFETQAPLIVGDPLQPNFVEVTDGGSVGLALDMGGRLRAESAARILVESLGDNLVLVVASGVIEVNRGAGTASMLIVTPDLIARIDAGNGAIVGVDPLHRETNVVSTRRTLHARINQAGDEFVDVPEEGMFSSATHTTQIVSARFIEVEHELRAVFADSKAEPRTYELMNRIPIVDLALKQLADATASGAPIGPARENAIFSVESVAAAAACEGKAELHGLASRRLNLLAAFQSGSATTH